MVTSVEVLTPTNGLQPRPKTDSDASGSTRHLSPPTKQPIPGKRCRGALHAPTVRVSCGRLPTTTAGNNGPNHLTPYNPLTAALTPTIQEEQNSRPRGSSSLETLETS